MDFLSGDGSSLSAVPILVAVTAERAHPDPMVLLDPENAKPNWRAGCEHAGMPARITTQKTGRPEVGTWCTQIDFPANIGPGVPYGIFHLTANRTKLEQQKYRYLSFYLYSRSSGHIDIMLPQAEWRSTLMAGLELSASRGQWIRVRLDLENDFKQTGNKFTLTEMRPEILFYHDRMAEPPRRGATFSITDIRFE